MSEFRVNSITNQDGSAGPQVCGVSTFSGSYTNTMEFKQISSSGDMIDFGDLQGVGGSREGASNGHGGLG